ncbi:glutathione S-transferase N-terminal domain-containing protein [Aestuariispira insulae]|uniref:Glutathione S-transferase n=1 Tax=Aestuariispira insulae TaxID=1461337 RepID=A0A3D9HXE9_9PROT|nr:glutathione S-transferase N-terminal domain-containing protein [Aestuariispira insulae]RED54090.1 glutathione S-transferase [Aestuariispira insulae]
MQLLCSPSSPYVRKARIVRLEKKLTPDISETMVVAMESPPQLLDANPLSKIPALVRPGLPPLFDSPVICEYLDSLPSPVPALLVEKGEARWQALRLQAMADGAIDACFNMVTERRRDEEKRSPLWQDRWMNAVMRSLDRMEQECGTWQTDLDLGQIATGCLLGYLGFRFESLDWRANRPHLAKKFDEWMARPSFRETIPFDPT